MLPFPGKPLPTAVGDDALFAPTGPLHTGSYISAPALEALEEATANATVLVPPAVRRRQLAIDLLAEGRGSCLAFFPEVGGLHPPAGLGMFCGLALVGVPLSRFRCFSATLLAFDPVPITRLHNAALLQALTGGSSQPRLLWLSAEGRVVATVDGYYVTASNSRKALLPARRAP